MEFKQKMYLLSKNKGIMKKYLLLCLLSTTLILAQKPVFTSAKVDAVTVYFNSAEMSQSTQVNLPAGTFEIVVKNVSNYLNEQTVLVGAPSTVTVLSVQFTTNYISEFDQDEKSPALKSVRDSIVLVANELNKLKNEKSSTSKTIELLDANQNISGANTGLNLAELTKIVDYYKAKRTELSNSLLVLGDKEKKLTEKLANLNTRLSFNQEKEEKMSKGKLILQVMNNVAGNVPLQISYLTQGATWTPFYDLRAENISSPIQMLYKAQVVQNTGIDWKKVKLTLSSGVPNQNNVAPVLNQWFLSYQNYDYKKYDYDKDARVMEDVVVGAVAKNKLPGPRAEAVSEAKAVAIVSPVNSTITQNQLNVSFDIDIPYDILSNSKQHSVILNEIKIPATYRYFAVPKMDTESYLVAEVNNYSQYNLLKGNANIIFEGMYVGKTAIDPNQTSDTLNLSMGKDKRVSIKREKIADKSGTKFLSSSKEQTFTYEIQIKNNKKESINLTLQDQYPLSTDESIKIELLDNGGASVDKDTGMLSWKLKLSPNETKRLKIAYKIKSPKDRVIDNL